MWAVKINERIRKTHISSLTTTATSRLPRRCKELLAQLDANARIHRTHDAVPKRHLDLPSDGLHDAGQVMVLPLAVLHPRREIAQLAIIPVVREPHLRPDEQDLAVVDDHAAVVDHVLVYHRPVGVGMRALTAKSRCKKAGRTSQCRREY